MPLQEASLRAPIGYVVWNLEKIDFVNHESKSNHASF